MTGCRTCGAKLGRGNKRGYCKDHRGDALRMFFFLNPEAKDRARKTIVRNSQTEYAKQRRSEAAKRIRLHEIGWEAQNNPSSRKKRAQTQSDQKLSWCPRELRDEYKLLTRTKKLPSSEAKAIILDQHDRNLKAFRERLRGLG